MDGAEAGILWPFCEYYSSAKVNSYHAAGTMSTHARNVVYEYDRSFWTASVISEEVGMRVQ